MDISSQKEKEFRSFLLHFSKFISFHICKFDLYNHGIDPDDIFQDVRLKIWKLFSSEKNISNYPSYIKKIVESSVIDQLRKLRREEFLINVEKKRFVAEHEIEYNSEYARLINIEESIGNAVNSLKDSRRQVVKLYLLNLNINEISAYLNWTKSKTRNLLYRGLSDLRESLAKMDLLK